MTQSYKTATISPQRIQELLAAAKAKHAASHKKTLTETLTETSVSGEDSYVTYDRYGNLISYNEKQREFLSLAASGKSCVLIGSAGTGKTTCMRGVIETLIQQGRVAKLEGAHKHLREGTPGIIIISYTRRAVSNIKRVLSQEIKDNAITYHKLMEYEPVFYEVVDPETGEARNTMKFEPARNPYTPLSSTISTIIVEESSMLSVEYWNLLVGALHEGVQVIFLGDIYQLPPVFGAAILGYKLTSLPVVELTEVYRQALNSPIISYAHKIKNGEGFHIPEKITVETEDGKVTLHPWKKKLIAEDALSVAAKFFIQAHKAGIYTPGEDMILIPFNKAYGTIELNKYIASYLATLEPTVPVWEIVAGFNKIYLRVGEKIMYDKEDAEILEIKPNRAYFGKIKYQNESPHLDYWGCDQTPLESQVHHISDDVVSADDEENIDFILGVMSSTSDEDRIHVASHAVKIKLLDSDREIWLNSAAEMNSILLGYALTVHKAQGSEWGKVFLLFHHSHATMLSRELLYTAFTRAKNEVYCICEKDTFVKGVQSQRIKGNTLAEKAEYFKGKALDSGVEVL
jgi:exodeoxyribonuclease V alpha subunit